MPDLEVLLGLSKLFSLSVNELIEKPVFKGITDYEDIFHIDKGLLLQVLGQFEFMEIVYAAKGSSPQVCSLLNDLFLDENLYDKMAGTGPVKVSKIEQVHQLILDSINEALLDQV